MASDLSDRLLIHITYTKTPTETTNQSKKIAANNKIKITVDYFPLCKGKGRDILITRYHHRSYLRHVDYKACS